MADLEITVSVEGVDDLSDALDDALRLVVHKEPGCCERCLKNENPDALPVHPRCRCTAVLADD